MQDIKIEGIGKMGAGEYGDIKTDGSGSCEGSLKSVVLKVDGALKVSGSIEAEVLSIDGKLKAEGDIIAAEIDCDGMAKIEGGVRAKIIDSDGAFTVLNNVNADRIDCNGMIDVPHGTVSADVIRVDGCIFAREIVGDDVRIKMSVSPLIKPFFAKNAPELEVLEATKIDIKGVKAKSVAGEDIVIGSRCEIEKLHCTGTLKLHEDSKIGEITGNYTLI